ncbi:MAG: hypothetical protein JWM33_1711 [Caulobacteraceae bacterium]|nr:hypothetical protein [Caulobacteraceae bacterium]
MLHRFAFATLTLILAGCAASPRLSASPGRDALAVPVSECAVYAAGMRSQPDIPSLDPTVAALSPTKQLQDLESSSPQQVAGFALQPGRRARASIGGCDLGPTVSISPDGLLATRLLFRRDGAAAIFLVKGPFTRRAVVVERDADGAWRGRTAQHTMVDPPLRVPRQMLVDPEGWNALSDEERLKALGWGKPP